jgi:MFS family permease
MLVQGAALLAGVPFIYGMGQSGNLYTTYIFLALFGLCRGMYDANIYATLFDVIEPRYRATGAGLMSMFAFLSGALSPFLLGYLKPTLGLSNGISFMAIAYLFSGLCIFTAIRWFLKKDFITQPESQML